MTSTTECSNPSKASIDAAREWLDDLRGESTLIEPSVVSIARLLDAERDRTINRLRDAWPDRYLGAFESAVNAIRREIDDES